MAVVALCGAEEIHLLWLGVDIDLPIRTFLSSSPSTGHHNEHIAMGVWQWYKGLAPNTRILMGVGIMAYAGAGMFLTDKVEEKIGFVATDKDKEDLRQAMPKITVVERGSR
ncbi:hypothetical protein P280DRAFT_521252 [Massarina eburnea CBS 473.64]|uniref:Uncharacterized protein n=1 Tax=Massarina eburnea CBS 473.64 TaxID=1395130 RepID=A0A6A6RQA8_9PLEO|nr:hypothetical protein P280DRAFT_521252 [Massarina eburnea CBS 473.64]